ncbi:helix-turn-helix domain-containing protein [Streptomyces mutomycini]|uniref:Helix-turn-helix domain-containing protein n=2 Tax=Streptomyces TaxID=1883 RepID=A0ABW0AX73_9ACTN|nr:helix-turn-helix domain-containing protein [Streptomyces mutomycini]
MPSDETPDLIVEVTEQLKAEHAELGRQAAAAIFSTLPSYTGVDETSVRASVGRNTARAIATLVSHSAPEPGTSAEAAMTTSERLQQGVPIEDIIRGYRISLRVIHHRFIELASAKAMPADRILEYSNLLWEVGDWFTAGAAAEYRDHEVRSAVRDSMRQVELFRELLAGGLSEPQIRAAAASLALDPSARYAVFRMHSQATTVDAVRARMDALTPRPELVTVSGRSGWIGLTSAPDTLVELPHLVAVGPAVPLDELASSERIATRILDLVVDEAPRAYALEDVTWRLATVGEPAVTALLESRYVAQAMELGEFGELMLSTVRAFLAADLNIMRASEALAVHPNTTRYRLARYEELVGVRLTATNTVIELAWVLDPLVRGESAG